MPLFSTAYAGVLYPLNLLYILFSPKVANFLELFHTILGAMGMFLFLRSLRLIPAASFAGGILFVSQTFFMNHSPHVSMRETALLAPWIAWLCQRLIRRPRAGRAFALSLGIALQIAAGYAQIVMMTMLWLVFLWIAQIPLNRKGIRKTVWFFVALGSGAGLMSLQILPSLEHVKATFRAHMTLMDWQTCSFHPSHLILFFSPLALGSPNTYWIGNELPGELLTTLSSAGWALALASILLLFFNKSLRKGLRVRFVFLMLLGIVLTLMLSFGKHFSLNKYLFHVTPLNLFRIPSRWLFLTCTFVSSLSALAIHFLMRFQWYKRILVFVFSWVLWGVICTASFYLFVHTTEKAKEFMPGISDILGQTRALSFQPITQALTRCHLPTLGGLMDRVGIHLLLALLMGVSLFFSRRYLLLLCMVWFFGLSLDGWILSHYLLPSPHTAEAIKKVMNLSEHPLFKDYPIREINRIYSLDPYDNSKPRDLAVPHNTNLFLGLSSLKGYCPLIDQHFSNVMSISQNGNGWNDISYYANPAPLQMLGVSHLIVNEKDQTPDREAIFKKNLGRHYRVIKQIDGLALVKLLPQVPRFDLAPQWHPIANIHEANAYILKDSRPVSERPAVISKYSLERMPPEGTLLSKGSVEPIIDNASYKKLRVKTQGRGIVLIRDIYWKGWKYRIIAPNEKFRKLYPAFGMIYYIPVPGGDVEVELKFIPPGWGKGVGYTLGTIAIWMMISLTCLSLKKRRISPFWGAGAS